MPIYMVQTKHLADKWEALALGQTQSWGAPLYVLESHEVEADSLSEAQAIILEEFGGILITSEAKQVLLSQYGVK